MSEKVTVLLPTYNSKIFLDQCLPPVLTMDYPNYEILIVDDCSSDDTVEYVQAHYPQVRVIPLAQHSGHSKACNTGILNADARYVYIIEHHTIVTKEALSQLMQVMHSEEQAAICYSTQLNVYSNQNIVVEGKRFAHYVVNQQCERHPWDGSDPQTSLRDPPVDTTSAGTFSYLIDKVKLAPLGYFDETYFLYVGDYELTFRVKAAGLRCYYVPQSVIYHKSFVETASQYNFRGGAIYPALRTFFISRNRWLMICSHYAVKTILLLLPAFIVYESLLIGFVIRRRVLGAYLKAIGWMLTHPNCVLEKRRRVQQVKCVSDAKLLGAGELNFVTGLAQSRLEKTIIACLTRFLTGYWNLVKAAL